MFVSSLSSYILVKVYIGCSVYFILFFFTLFERGWYHHGEIITITTIENLFYSWWIYSYESIPLDKNETHSICVFVVNICFCFGMDFGDTVISKYMPYRFIWYYFFHSVAVFFSSASSSIFFPFVWLLFFISCTFSRLLFHQD